MKVSTTTVRIRGWNAGPVASGLQRSVEALLTDAAGFDHDQAGDAVQRLMKGKAVEVQFDLGDETFARTFRKRLAQYGLASTGRVKREKVRLTFPGFEFFGWLAAVALGPVVIYGIFAARWTRLLIFAIALGAILSAVVVRVLARRSNRTLEQLERFDADTKAG